MWWFLIVFVVAFAISYASGPKIQSAKPAGFSDLKVPTAEEGREIPVLFGTRDLLAPNVVWYGNLETRAVKKKGGKK